MLPGSYELHRRGCPERSRQVATRCLNVALHLIERWLFPELEWHGGLQPAGQIQHPTLHQESGDPGGGALERDRGLRRGGPEKSPHVVPHLEMTARRDLRECHGKLPAHLIGVVNRKRVV